MNKKLYPILYISSAGYLIFGFINISYIDSKNIYYFCLYATRKKQINERWTEFENNWVPKNNTIFIKNEEQLNYWINIFNIKDKIENLKQNLNDHHLISLDYFKDKTGNYF